MPKRHLPLMSVSAPEPRFTSQSGSAFMHTVPGSDCHWVKPSIISLIAINNHPLIQKAVQAYRHGEVSYFLPEVPSSEGAACSPPSAMPSRLSTTSTVLSRILKSKRSDWRWTYS